MDISSVSRLDLFCGQLLLVNLLILDINNDLFYPQFPLWMTSTETMCRSTLCDRPVRACGSVWWTSPNGDAGSCILITGHISHSRSGESGREQILRTTTYNTSSGSPRTREFWSAECSGCKDLATPSSDGYPTHAWLPYHKELQSHGWQQEGRKLL